MRRQTACRFQATSAFSTTSPRDLLRPVQRVSRRSTMLWLTGTAPLFQAATLGPLLAVTWPRSERRTMADGPFISACPSIRSDRFTVPVRRSCMDRQHPFVPSDGDEPTSEQRTSRIELLWPPSVRARVIELAASRGVSINEVVLRCVETGLSSPAVHSLLDQAAARRRPNRRYRPRHHLTRAA